MDDGITRGATRSTAMVVWAGGSNARLVFINEAVAPDTYSVAPIDDGVRWLPGTTAQITDKIDSGLYCVKLYDNGRLKTDVSFAIRIVYP